VGVGMVEVEVEYGGELCEQKRVHPSILEKKKKQTKMEPT